MQNFYNRQHLWFYYAIVLLNCILLYGQDDSRSASQEIPSTIIQEMSVPYSQDLIAEIV
jgi:hypothetical protein